MKLSSLTLDGVLITSIIPYFLEKGNFWFQQNLKKILEARKNQSFFEDNTLYLTKNQNCNFSQFLRKLNEMGYERVWQVSEPGEFSQKGGIIDVFPINLNRAIRFEFLGNKIEEIWELPIEIENEKISKEILKKKLKSQKLFSDLKGIKPGDYLVHLDHGIGKFKGVFVKQEKEHSAATPDHKKLSNRYYLLEYAAGDKLYIPLGLERKLSHYIGFVEPKISRLGSQNWQRTKKKVKKEAEKLARELLEIYAQREIVARPPYLPENEIDFQLASSFPYEETPDQIEALEDIKRDLERDKPMDRIVCGDVGFGKTEVALRTMIKAVNSGYQTAMICPTTILANQHYQNFRERLKNLPVKISLLSRLQSKKEQKEIIEKCFNENVIIQWIGDVNQAIMNDNYAESAWKPENNERCDVMYLNKSHRISQNIANIIEKIAFQKDNNYLTGTNIKIKPKLIVFNTGQEADSRMKCKTE